MPVATTIESPPAPAPPLPRAAAAPVERLTDEAPLGFSPFPVLLALWLTVFAASSQVIIVSPILPEIALALAVPESHLGWIVTAYAAFLGVFALLAGPVSDRVGRRRILLWGASALALALGLHVFATTFPLLLLVRAVAGAAAGLLSGASVSYVGDAFPYERRGWANGWVMSGIAAGQVLGVPAGKGLAMQFGFQAPFLAFAVLMLGAVGLIWRWLPQPPVARTTAPLTPGGMVRAYAALVRQPGPRAAMLAYLLMFGGLGLFVPYFPTWLERDIGVHGGEIVWLFFVGGLINVATGPLAGRLSDRVGRRPLIFASCLIFAAALVATTWLVNGLVGAIVLFAVIMLTVAMRLSPLQSLLSALVPDQQRGLMMSGAVSVGQLGMAISAGVAGVLYGAYGFRANTLVGAVALLGMALVVYVGLPEPVAPESGVPETALAGAAA